ncbi:hypothetical protein JVU11DRAFT_7559 [Chiua virens]|nr:hypothetical protein JVU11DRAFT_7559 [Chiua virens]
MSTEESTQEVQADVQDAKMREPPTAPAAMATANKRRPRIDFTVLSGERKRGKSMFGLVVGTLNKAKIEDKERNASEAAKKRQLIEQRLQDKLRKETDSVRRAEEAKKDKTAANRREEELQLKDSIYKLRHVRLPLLSNFLLTSDIIPPSDASPPPSTNPLAPPSRSHPPPLYYIPAVLTPAQEAFLVRRKAEVTGAAEREWEAFRDERTSGIEEIKQFRQRVTEEEARRKREREDTAKAESEDKEMAEESSEFRHLDADMEVDEEPKPEPESAESERKDESGGMRADDEDAVEY